MSTSKQEAERPFARRIQRLVASIDLVPASTREVHAQLFSRVLLILLPLGYVLSVIPSYFWSGRSLLDHVDSMMGAGAVLFWVVSFWLNRASRYRVGVGLAIVTGASMIFGSAIWDNDANDLYYLMLPVFLGSVIFPTWATLGMVFVQLASVLMLPVWLSDITTTQIIVGPFTFLALASALMLLISRHRDRLEAIRRAQLAASEARYRQAVENSPNPIFTVNREGFVQTWNRACASILQAGHDFAGQHISALLSETEDADAVCTLITAVFDEQRTFIRELQFQCMDSTNSHAHCEMASHLYPLLDEQGRVHGCVIANTDVTARRDAEIQRFELALEQERVKVLERFIGDMSHDLRTPLTKLSTALYLLERVDDAGKRDRYFKMLRDQVDHMDRMFVNMLQVLRSDRPHDYDFGRRDMNSLVSTVVEGLHLRAVQKSQRLAYNGDETLPPVWADEGSLRVAFGKIIENALTFTPADGSIMCRTMCREQEVIVEVVDTGEGVDPADMPHIFEHFYRGDPARRATKGGTGLGLALAKKIVEGHQGRIEVESEPGVGSTFRICLPAIAERAEQD